MHDRDPSVRPPRLAFAACFAVVLGASATIPAQSTQERIEELAGELAEAADSRAAEAALVRIGRPAVRRLIACVEQPDADERAERLLLRSARILGQIGSDAADALGPLAAAMTALRATVHKRVLAAQLRELRPRHAPSSRLVDVVLACDPEYELLSQLADAYTRIEWTSPTDVEELVAALQSPNPVVRELAAGQLAALGPAAVDALEALQRALHDNHPTFSIPSPDGRRAAFAMVLAGGGAAVNLARPTGGVPLLDRSDAVRDAVARAMVLIAPDQPEVVSAYIRLLTHAADEGERREAVMALGRLGDRGRPAYFLKPLLDDENPAIVREVIVALGMIGPPAADAMPKLEQLAEHEDRQIRARARAALKQIRGR